MHCLSFQIGKYTNNVISRNIPAFNICLKQVHLEKFNILHWPIPMFKNHKFWSERLACAVTELSVHYQRFFFLSSFFFFRRRFFSPIRGYRRVLKFCMGF